MRKEGLAITFTLILGLSLALLWLLVSGLPARAAAAVLQVCPTGCAYSSIQTAIDDANPDDTVRVASGTYYESIDLNKSIILEGGWNADFTVRDWDLYPTTIDAGQTDSVIQVHGTVSPTIEGFVITGGDGTLFWNGGGGIEVYGDVVMGGGTVVIRHNVITDNIACRLTACLGQGGGIRIDYSTAIIEHNTIMGNVARLDGNGNGLGGGVMVGSNGLVTLTANTIVDNIAIYTPTGASNGRGGGVYIGDTDSILIDNEIRDNVAAVGGEGRGGGVFLGGQLYNNRIFSNTASINGVGYGGGIYAEHVPICEDNTVQGNIASQNDDGTGGGIWARGLKQADGNTIERNMATRGGGIYYSSYSGELVLSDNLIVNNRTTGTASVPPDGGGGIASAANKVKILNNRILTNTAYGGIGGGVLFMGGDEFIFQGNQVISNTAVAGGGLSVFTATGSISNNQVIENMAFIGGGLYVWGTAQPVLDGNIVMENMALGFYVGGGGIVVNVDSGIPILMTNQIIARNAAGSGGPGGGVFCLQGNCVLINNTIVDNDRGDYKEGVYLAGSSGVHTLQNNIIVGHSIGVNLTAGTATLDYNNYYDNDTDVSGATWGVHHRTDDPLFLDRVGADFHLMLTSPLIDQANGSIAPDQDFEGEPRPRGSGFDIGADEAYPMQVYVSEHIGSDLSGDGSQNSPYASVTKGLINVGTGGVVYVARGNYTERITVTRNVDLLGGYLETDWSRDIAGNAAILDAQGTGTVVVILGEGVDVTLEGFTITGGGASVSGSGGGVFVFDAQTTIRYNTIMGNRAQNGGGLFIASDYGVQHQVDSNIFYNNVAEGVLPPRTGALSRSPFQGSGTGGGMIVVGMGSTRIINNLVYSNTAGASGDGIAVFLGESVQLWHNTIADNGGMAGVALYIIASSAEVCNNLIVGHATAISGTQAALGFQAVWDYNGFYDNVSNYAAGLSAGSHDVNAAPGFVNRPGFDYHLLPGSAMSARGTDLGVMLDLDRNPRPAPMGSPPDLGAYEIAFLQIYLPFVSRP